MIKKITNKFLDFIYPLKCVLCNNSIIKREKYLCDNCIKSFKIESHINFLEVMKNKNIECISPFKYDGNIKNAICRFKFQGYKNYSEFFSKIISREIQNKLKDCKFDYICFVPLGIERQKNRGYNQAECLAIEIGKNLNITCQSLLIKIKSNHTQHELNLIERTKNVIGVYGTINTHMIKDKNILICDDIITSGNTLLECAKTLINSGAKNVYCCTIAYIPKWSVSNKNL